MQSKCNKNKNQWESGVNHSAKWGNQLAKCTSIKIINMNALKQTHFCLSFIFETKLIFFFCLK